MVINGNLSKNLILSEIGERIKQFRIGLFMTQNDLAKKTGISLRNIVRIENGEDTAFSNIIKILSVFKLQNNLDLLIVDQLERPSYKIKNKTVRKRASKKRTGSEHFVWGEDK